MAGIKTPAIQSIEAGEIMSEYANIQANEALIKEGINPLLAFVDTEIQRHHRAIALQASASFKRYISNCLNMEGIE